MDKAIYQQKMEVTGSMLSFLDSCFSHILCLCHRKIIYAVLIALDENESKATSIMTFTILVTVIFHSLMYFYMHLKKVQIQIIFD